ncbi:MAG TPA: M14 metallopeptidase family protein [Edaphobacter sp.]|nr:M14 metallopeptidase family protein [Edaphobacter sp.]
MKLRTLLLSLSVLTLLAVLPGLSQTVETPRKITTPKQALGFNIGDDYYLANYAQLTAYWQTLAKESDRMKLVDIGPTAENRRQYMAIISSPENIAKLDHYKEISSKLARAENLTDAEAHALSEEGRAIVWIDGGLHASETVGAQQLIETVYQLNSLNDPETLRFLHDDIILCVLDNPDGMDLVSNWYMREPTPDKRVTEGPAGATPRLWHHYIGHDNNRDFYMNNMPESTNISRILFRDWYPQIMYNHHQSGPLGTVIFMPPFRDPFNYHYDPLIPLKIEAVGTAMHERLVEEGKPGSGMRSTATYSTWYNGGLRTVTYFHNMTGVLTEIIGSPTPMQLTLVPARQLPSNDLPFPVAPQLWHNRQSIDYEQTNNRAILDYASREREHLLYDTYRMAKNSIERGNEDSWTVTPKRIEALEAEAAKTKSDERPAGPSFDNARTAPANLYKKVLHDPTQRDPRGYILSADQPDFPTATKFVNALMKSGVEIQQATADFEVAGKHYPENSYVILCAQAYRPHILDMFEPQDHPNDFAYPGGPPNRPYDATGWTLAFQMGVQFDRELEPFTGPFTKITTDLAKPIPGTITGPAKPAGYLVSHAYNDAYTLTNRLLKANQPVYWLTAKTAVDNKELAPGALWLPYSAETQKLLETATQQLGINAYAVAKKPTGEAIQLHAEKIALYDQYGGLMPSGWIRWLLEQFEFPFTVIYPQTLDAGDLHQKFDDILFSDGAISAPREGQQEGRVGRQPKPEQIPAEFRPWLGTITANKTIPQLQKFVEEGGTLLAIGSSSTIYQYFHLPLQNAITEIIKGKDQAVPPERFYIPGSLMRTQVDTTNPVAYGMPTKVDVFFDRSPAFRADPNANLRGIQTIAWYADGNLLDSGWAWGQQYLNNSIAVAQANMGKGKVLLYGPEITFRGQPHATFKFLFNGLLYGPSTTTTLK